VAARELLHPPPNFEIVWEGLGLMKLLEVTPQSWNFAFAFFLVLLTWPKQALQEGS